MLTMMMVLGIGSTLIEMIFVYHVRPVRELARRYVVVGLIFSFGLSWLMGIIFGVETGLIIFGGAIMSTALSAVIYSLHLIELFEVTMKQFGKVKVATIEYASKARESYDDVKNVAHVTRVKYQDGKRKVKRVAFCTRHPLKALTEK